MLLCAGLEPPHLFQPQLDLILGRLPRHVIVTVAMDDLVELVRECRHQIAHPDIVDFVSLEPRPCRRNLGAEAGVLFMDSFGVSHVEVLHLAAERRPDGNYPANHTNLSALAAFRKSAIPAARLTATQIELQPGFGA